MQKDFVQYFFLNCGYNWVIFCAIRFTALHIFCPTWMFLERYFRKESILFTKFYMNYKNAGWLFNSGENLFYFYLSASSRLWSFFFVKTCSISVAGSWNPTWWSFRSGSSSICVQRTMASFTITITIIKTTLMTDLRQTLWHFLPSASSLITMININNITSTNNSSPNLSPKTINIYQHWRHHREGQVYLLSGVIIIICGASTKLVRFQKLSYTPNSGYKNLKIGKLK